MDRGTIASRTATIEGVKLHYLTAGHGPTLILLHGYTQTSRMWKPVIPPLAEKFTVIAPDLPGIGDSAIPKFPASTCEANGVLTALTHACQAKGSVILSALLI